MFYSLGKLLVPGTQQKGWPWTEASPQLPEALPDGAPWPRISVVTPSYNQGAFIEETLRSALLQGYPNLELIVIDGGSTDQTLDVIRKYEPWLAYWVSEPDRGQGHAINKGIRQATGEVLLWLNSDDICLPGAFQLAARALHDHPENRMVVGQAWIIDEYGQKVGELHSQFSTWEELATNPRNSLRQVSTFFDRKLFTELGPVNENLHIALDNELMVRFTCSSAPVVLNEYLTAYRVHPDAKTSTQLIRGYQETDAVRLKLLGDKRLQSTYRKRSAFNWLSLFESDRYPRKKRFACLSNALKIYPRVVCSPRFWSAVKWHTFD